MNRESSQAVLTRNAAASGVRRMVLALVFAGAFITYLDRVCLSVAAPAMQSAFGLSDVQFGWVFTVFYMAYAAAELPVSWLGDVWGQRRMLVRIVGCWSVFTALTGAVRGFGTLLATRTIFGAAEAGAFPTMSRALSRWFPAGERARANGIMWMGARSGGAFAPPLAVALITLVGWRGAFGVFGAAGAVWAVIWAVWFRDDPANHKSVNPQELAVIRAGAIAGPEPITRLRWRRLLLNPTMLALFASYFASGFGFQFFVTWLPTYFMREHGLSLRKSGMAAALPLAAGALGCGLGGVFADFLARRRGIVFGRRAVAVGGYAIGGIGYLTAVYMQSTVAAVAFLTIASGAHDLTLPVMWSTTTDAGGRFGGTAGGFINVASSISGMMAPLTAAAVESAFGSFRAVFWIAAGLYFAAAVLWLFIDPRKRIFEPQAAARV